MLLIGVVLLSFWKSLPPSAFQAWFASYSPLVGGLMLPLGFTAILVTLASLVACWRSPLERRWLLIAAILAVVVMGTYPLFFEATNAAFVRGGLSDEAVRSMLDQWTTWHWIRTSLGILGFLSALRALNG
ncbi:MAG TPA: DUF1772 domain-containing protein [Acidobacteriota bacterium]|nr:DUF1772 domain-containing protein [Acidobacteriota bacterium]